MTEAYKPAQYQIDRKKKPHYYEKGGKIYHLGVEINDKEAAATIQRHRASKAKNSAEVDAARKQGDGPRADIMKSMADLAAYDMDDDERELTAILSKRKKP